MPLLKNAIKKMRQDKKRTEINKGKKTKVRTMLKAARVEATPEALAKAYSVLDKAAKTHLIHKKKADRLKARLAAAVAKVGEETKVVTKAKKPTKKATKKSVKKTTKTK